MRIPALTLLFLTAAGTFADAGDAWFRNVAEEAGLAGVRAKDCVFADLDGDGFWDLCLCHCAFHVGGSPTLTFSCEHRGT